MRLKDPFQSVQLRSRKKLKEQIEQLRNSAKMRRLFGDWKERLSKLSHEKQIVFLEDIAEAANNRFKVLERTAK